MSSFGEVPGRSSTVYFRGIESAGRLERWRLTVLTEGGRGGLTEKRFQPENTDFNEASCECGASWSMQRPGTSIF